MRNKSKKESRQVKISQQKQVLYSCAFGAQINICMYTASTSFYTDFIRTFYTNFLRCVYVLRCWTLWIWKPVLLRLHSVWFNCIITTYAMRLSFTARDKSYFTVTLLWWFYRYFFYVTILSLLLLLLFYDVICQVHWRWKF